MANRRDVRGLVWFAATAILAACAGEPRTAAQPGGYNPIGYQGFDIPPCIDHDAKDGATKPKDAGQTGTPDSGSPTVADTGIAADSVAVADAGAVSDAGAVADTAAVVDAGAALDAGAGTDAGSAADAGSSGDAGSANDAGSVAVDAGPPPLNFTTIYNEVFKKFGCTASLCHGAKAGDMGFFTDQKKAYDLLVNKASKVKDCKFLPIVLPGKPETSVLYTKIKPWMKTCGDKMPIGTDGVTEAAAKLVYDWIKKGAPK